MKEILISDHHEIDAILGRVFSALDTGDPELIYQTIDLFWARLALHIRAENVQLFPSILRSSEKQRSLGEDSRLPSPDHVEKTIIRLENDHNFFMRELGDAIKKLFDVRHNSAKQTLPQLREKFERLSRRLKEHNEVEESFVYSWAEALDPAITESLKTKVEAELSNLPQRFRERPP